MAEQVVMPKQGNTVESCVILQWRKGEGDVVAEGDVLCEVESDKAAFDVESTVAGRLLRIYFEEGDEVPVLTPIAAVGNVGEEVPEAPTGHAREEEVEATGAGAADDTKTGGISAGSGRAAADSGAREMENAGVSAGIIAVSPRARRLAEQNAFDVFQLAGSGTGPGGRIIERDVRAALEAVRGRSGNEPGAPETADCTGQRGGAPEAVAGAGYEPGVPAKDYPGEVREIPVAGIRSIVGGRMVNSLHTTAQLTLHASADARGILAYRERLKNSKKELGLRDITLNDLVFYAAIQTLKRHPSLNAHFLGDRIIEFASVHAAFAVDTERGLMVPVIRFADELSLKEFSAEAARLAGLCVYGGINPDDLSGGTFTVSNLGVLGVEMFTPILNPPQAAILGICNIQHKPVAAGEETVFHPHLGLSLTADHQAVDGAPAARYLKSLCEAIASFELILAG